MRSKRLEKLTKTLVPLFKMMWDLKILFPNPNHSSSTHLRQIRSQGTIYKTYLTSQVKNLQINCFQVKIWTIKPNNLEINSSSQTQIQILQPLLLDCLVKLILKINLTSLKVHKINIKLHLICLARFLSKIIYLPKVMEVSHFLINQNRLFKTKNKAKNLKYR